jgi:hypothetical protein
MQEELPAAADEGFDYRGQTVVHSIPRRTGHMHFGTRRGF